MKYFCAECQEKYDVGDIAANLYEICKDEVINNLITVFKSSEHEMFSLYEHLATFVNTDAEKYLTVKGSEAQKYIRSPRIRNNMIEGRLTLTVAWLLEKFVDSGAYKSYVLDKHYSCEKPENVSEEMKTQILFEKNMIFYFSSIGANGEKVLDHITDGDNNPFAVDDTTGDGKTTMRGYIRTCPHCGKQLPRAVGRAPEVVVWLAGTSRAAKTSSFISIAYGLSSGKYSQYGLAMQTLTYDKQWDATKKEIDNYKLGYPVTKTPTNLDEVPSQSLLVQVGDSAESSENRVLTFVDVPGEFFDNQGQGPSKEFFEMYSKRMLCNIDFIWLHISKLAPYEIDLDIKGEKQERIINATNEKAASLKNCNAEHLKSILSEISSQLKATGCIMPPTAVILTKSEVDLDDIENVDKYSLFPVENGRLSQNVNAANANEIRKILVADKRGRYRLDEKNFFNRALKVRNFFEAVNPGMAKAIESNCPYRCYISTAAYGHPAALPIEKGKQYEPTPYHEMFPLIWTMAMTGAIQIDHLCSWAEKNIFGGFKSSIEGSMPVRFISGKYIRGIVPSGKTKQETADKIQCDKDVASNLLMENISGNKLVFTPTAFLHRKE